MKVVKDTRWEALKTANDFLNQEIPFVTIIADGRVYTAEEGFMTTLMQPSFFARNVLYSSGPCSRVARCVTTKDGSISPFSIRSINFRM